MMAKCGQSRLGVYVLVDLAAGKNCKWNSNKCTTKMGL